MRDLTSPAWMYLKAVLLLGAGMLSSLLLFLRQPGIATAALIAVSVWAFCRAYYFAFYVVERYVDPAFRFSGLWSAGKYLVTAIRRRNRAGGA